MVTSLSLQIQLKRLTWRLKSQPTWSLSDKRPFQCNLCNNRFSAQKLSRKPIFCEDSVAGFADYEGSAPGQPDYEGSTAWQAHPRLCHPQRRGPPDPRLRRPARLRDPLGVAGFKGTLWNLKWGLISKLLVTVYSSSTPISGNCNKYIQQLATFTWKFILKNKINRVLF